MKISTFGFLTRRGVRNLGKHWAMTIACIASLSVCMTLNIFASLIEVNVDSMVSYLGSQNEMVVYVDPEADDATIQSVGNALSGTAGVSRVQYMSKEDVLNQYKGYMSDYAALLNEFENDNPFKANYRVSLSDLNQMETISKQFENISGVYSVTAPIEMTKTFVEIQQAVTKVGRGVVLVPQRPRCTGGCAERRPDVRRCVHGHRLRHQPLHPEGQTGVRCGTGHRDLCHPLLGQLHRGRVLRTAVHEPVGPVHQ